MKADLELGRNGILNRYGITAAIDEFGMYRADLVDLSYMMEQLAAITIGLADPVEI